MKIWILKHKVRDFFFTALKGYLLQYLKIIKLLKMQKFLPYEGYADNYFYQGYERFGITGAKPTLFRLAQYEDLELPSGVQMLDIGSNVGFFSFELSRFGNYVTGIEINPVLVTAANYFRIKNNFYKTSFICSDFVKYNFEGKFQVIFSLSNHQTTDGNIRIKFNEYISKIHDLLEIDGIFIFESHNIFGPGKGLPGDDGDILDKINLLTHYFKIQKFKMVKSFLKNGKNDVNKLLIVMRRIEVGDGNYSITKKYNFFAGNFDYVFIEN